MRRRKAWRQGISLSWRWIILLASFIICTFYFMLIYLWMLDISLILNRNINFIPLLLDVHIAWHDSTSLEYGIIILIMPYEALQSFSSSLFLSFLHSLASLPSLPSILCSCDTCTRIFPLRRALLASQEMERNRIRRDRGRRSGQKKEGHGGSRWGKIIFFF